MARNGGILSNKCKSRYYNNYFEAFKRRYFNLNFSLQASLQVLVLVLIPSSVFLSHLVLEILQDFILETEDEIILTRESYHKVTIYVLTFIFLKALQLSLMLTTIYLYTLP